MELPTYDFGYATLDQVVEKINNAPVQGFEEHTAEYLAAAYANQAQEDAGYELDEAAAIEHFDVLRVAGAEWQGNEIRKVPDAAIEALTDKYNKSGRVNNPNLRGEFIINEYSVINGRGENFYKPERKAVVYGL